jgi:hypothetical protein
LVTPSADHGVAGGEQKAGGLGQGPTVSDGETPNFGVRLVLGVPALDKLANRLVEVIAPVHVMSRISTGPDGAEVDNG